MQLLKIDPPVTMEVSGHMLGRELTKLLGDAKGEYVAVFRWVPSADRGVFVIGSGAPPAEAYIEDYRFER